MPAAKLLIACIGNIFLGDDAFGCEVARELAHRPLPAGVLVRDFGVRGLDLAYCLLEESRTVILVDAVSRGQPPGTVFLIEPDLTALQPCGDEMLDGHTMQPEKVLRAAISMGAKLDRVMLVGCEATPFDPEFDMQMELTPPVRAAIPEAIRLIESQVLEILHSAGELAGAKGAMQ